MAKTTSQKKCTNCANRFLQLSRRILPAFTLQCVGRYRRFGWMQTSTPKKTAQEWINRIDQIDGSKTAANLVVAYKEAEYVKVMAYTSDATRMLRHSGKDGVFVSAPADGQIRKGYAPVWGRRSMTLSQMLDACDDTTLGLLRSEKTA